MNWLTITPSKLAIFDMDGTLIPGTTAAQEIAKTSDTLKEIQALESSYSRGEIDSMQFSHRANEYWHQSGPQLYQQAWEASPKLENISSTLASLRSNGFITCLITMAPIEFARCFQEFDYVYGSNYGKRIINPEDKPNIALNLQRKYQIDLENTFAFGDSHSDIPLFSILTNTLAVNGSPELQELAKAAYVGNDLREATELLIPECFQ